MWGWFGGSSSSQNRKDSPKNAILGLRSQLDMLQKRQTHLENQIEEQNAIARKHVAANNTSGKPRRAYMEDGGCKGRCWADL